MSIGQVYEKCYYIELIIQSKSIDINIESHFHAFFLASQRACLLFVSYTSNAAKEII